MEHVDRRHLPRLRNIRPQCPIYFVTTCTHQRQPFLANADLAAHATVALAEASAILQWYVGRFVVMPDHIHLFCSPTSVELPLQRFVGGLKQNMTRFAWSLGHAGPLWQREFHDHLLRNDESYIEKWEYVRHNPVRAQLVETPEEWPYQGELEVLQFR